MEFRKKIVFTCIDQLNNSKQTKINLSLAIIITKQKNNGYGITRRWSDHGMGGDEPIGMIGLIAILATLRIFFKLL